MFASFTNVHLEKLAVALPSKKVSYNDEIYKDIDDAKKQRLKSIIGFNERFVADQETALDLCELATKKLRLSPRSIDAVVFVTQTPDYFQPGNATILHGRMNLKKECLCLDINSGCTGFIQGLFQSHQLLQQTEINAVLLCVGDTISKSVNPSDPAIAPIFGDGGSAALLTKQQESNSYFSFETNGLKFDQLILRNGAYKNNLKNNDTDYLFMDGTEVMHMALAEVPQSVKEILSKYSLVEDNIDFFFLHQANNFIVESIAKNLHLSMAKVPIIFPSYGNQSSASIPFVIADTLKTKQAKNCLLSGFGVGFAWANAVIDLNEVEIFF